MPNILVKTMEHKSKVGSSGKTLTGIEITGTQLVDQHNFVEKEWSKFVFDWTGESAYFEGFKAGDSIKIINERDPNNSRFWRIVKVQYLDAAAAPPPAQAGSAVPPATTQPRSSSSTPVTPKGKRDPVYIRTDAVKFAVDFVCRMVDLGRYKKAATPEFLANECLNHARVFTAYMENKDSEPVVIKSAGKSVKEPVTPEVVSEQEEIPFD